ncbi:MAG: hypothetical protein MMC33_001159 [Icmadophila ericetorum]|nr:hypothetical protein [Icmadophila ericetorum]
MKDGQPSLETSSIAVGDPKSQVRERVQGELRKVALPDFHFHSDFSEFIADCRGSSEATERLLKTAYYQSAKVVFITPDNCLEKLRLVSLKAGKIVLITTYAIGRGFWLLGPATISPARFEYASTLDGMEKLGRSVTVRNMIAEHLKVDLMVTGTGAINLEGVRFGKGHGFFDLEWGMLYEIEVISQETKAAVLVHDCQVLNEKLEPAVFDTVCDLVVIPSRIIEVRGAIKPVCGIIWHNLKRGMFESIPPLSELGEIKQIGPRQLGYVP